MHSFSTNDQNNKQIETCKELYRQVSVDQQETEKESKTYTERRGKTGRQTSLCCARPFEMTPVQLILRCEHLLGLAVQDGADPEKCVLPAPKNELAAARKPQLRGAWGGCLKGLKWKR